MASGDREGGLARVAVAAAAGVALLALAGLGTANTLGIAATPEAHVPVPATAGGMIAAANRRFAESQDVPPGERPALIELARTAPLASDPFALLGFQAMREGDDQTAEALLGVARDRRPRSRVARYALLEIYGKHNDLKAMTGELVPLMRLEPELVEPLSKAWLKAISRPGQVQALAKVLKDEPAVYDRVATQAANGNLDPALLAAFLEYDPRADTEDSLPPYAAKVLGSLVRQGRYDQAYAIWRAKADNRGEAGQMPFNGKLTDRRSPPPFNWDPVTTDDGNAVWRKDGGIFVDYFGRGNSTLVRELVRLPAGSYRLKVNQSAEDTRGRGLAWQVRCADGGRTIFERPVAPAKSQDASLDAQFSVPAACAAQWIELVGRGDLHAADGQRLQIASVAIEPRGAEVQQ